METLSLAISVVILPSRLENAETHTVMMHDHIRN